MFLFRSLAAVAALALGAVAMAAHAQVGQPASPTPADAGNEPQDGGMPQAVLPARVGRIADVRGRVWLLDRQPSDASADAARDRGPVSTQERWLDSQNERLQNWPLSAGDRLRTAAGAHATLRVAAVTLRLDGGTELSIERLDRSLMAFRLRRGSLALRVLDGEQAREVEVRSDEGRFWPQRVGHYRFDHERGATQATAWRGELSFDGSDSSLRIPSGRRADFWLPRDGGATHFSWQPIERDAFAAWVSQDERYDEAPQAARRVSPDMTGWQDLDRYGDWHDHPEYGGLWVPHEQPADWAPYRQGRWAWVSPWGWTWIDVAPWGFAPFHYGRWLMFNGRWCWAPGPRGQRPVYAPVLSGWVGPGGSGVSIGITLGGGRRPPPPVIVRPPIVVVQPAPRPVVVHPPHREPPRHEPPRGWSERGERGERWDHGDRDRPPGEPRPGPRPDDRGHAGRPDVPTPRLPQRPAPDGMAGPLVTPPTVAPPVARPERPERPERPDRPDRPERGERPPREPRDARLTQ